MSKESKNEKFKRIASARTESILNKIKALTRCANSRSYEYTDIEVRKIFNAINSEIKIAKALFDKGTQKRNKRFSL